MSILKFLAPLKSKFLRANDANFVTKELMKANMLRLKLHNIYLNENSDDARLLYKIKNNVFVF